MIRLVFRMIFRHTQGMFFENEIEVIASIIRRKIYDESRQKTVAWYRYIAFGMSEKHLNAKSNSESCLLSPQLLFMHE